jgi:hypothetical protein
MQQKRYLGIDFKWSLENLDRSPEVRLQNGPQGVDHIAINFFCDTMHDPNRERGGGIIPYDGSGTIPAGAFDTFIVPKGLLGIMLETRATLKAFDKGGRLIGKGTITKKPPNI